ncbi:MAG: hypothetical protein WCZ89_05110 [Phycisphaerae bacterium]
MTNFAMNRNRTELIIRENKFPRFCAVYKLGGRNFDELLNDNHHLLTERTVSFIVFAVMLAMIITAGQMDKHRRTGNNQQERGQAGQQNDISNNSVHYIF